MLYSRLPKEGTLSQFSMSLVFILVSQISACLSVSSIVVLGRLATRKSELMSGSSRLRFCWMHNTFIFFSSEAKTAIIPAMWWPPCCRCDYFVDVVEPLDLLPRVGAKWPSFLPLVEAALEIGNVDLFPWCDLLRRVQVPPVVKMSGFPHGLMRIESSLMGRYLLSLPVGDFIIIIPLLASSSCFFIFLRLCPEGGICAPIGTRLLLGDHRMGLWECNLTFFFCLFRKKNWRLIFGGLLSIFSHVYTLVRRLCSLNFFKGSHFRSMIWRRA